MMPRKAKIALAILGVAVAIGVISFRSLHLRMQRLARAQAIEEQARHAVLVQPISTPSDVTAKANIFWAAGPDRVAPVEIEMPLSADPSERSRQLLQVLIANPPTPGQRTLPADATVLGFYILPDGTSVADFSDAIASEMPSGILSEEMAVQSITHTLGANVPGLRRLKILIHGQEVDTLAGHADLTGFFDLTAKKATPAASTATPAAAKSH